MLGRVARALSWMGAAALAAMMLITVTDVSLRHIVELPVYGTYDLVSLFLVAIVFLNLPQVTARNEHITVDLIDRLIGRHGIATLRVVGTAFGFCFIVTLAWHMFQPAADAVAFGQVTQDLAIPQVVHWVLMIFGVLVTVPMMGAALLQRLAAARDAWRVR